MPVVMVEKFDHEEWDLIMIELFNTYPSMQFRTANTREELLQRIREPELDAVLIAEDDSRHASAVRVGFTGPLVVITSNQEVLPATDTCMVVTQDSWIGKLTEITRFLGQEQMTA